jgi:hypothetical protein
MLPIAKQTQAINQKHATNMCYMNAQKKEEVIPSILAKESLDLELRLGRYGKKNVRDLFVISKKWLGFIWNYFFRIPGAFMKIGGLRVDFGKRQGVICKMVGIFLVSELFYNMK